jgi:ATP-binding cassette subfamily F protein 3
MSGKMVKADRLKAAYFAQHQLDELKPEQSPYDHMRTLMPDAPEAQVRARVGAIGFSGQAADAAVKTLSGGEKARLLLGLATHDGPHLLVLDEPTNHLDIDSRAALIEAVNDFPGAVVLVSHDRYLLEACADRLWLVADGSVALYDGDIDEYRRYILAGSSDDKAISSNTDAAPRAGRAEMRRVAAEKRAEFAPLQRQIKTAEATMARYSKRIAEIDAALADPQLYVRDATRAAALNKERAEISNALSATEDNWLALSSRYESAMAD